MMYETQLGPKTQHGTYNGSHQFLSFDPLATKAQFQPLLTNILDLQPSLNVVKEF